MADFVRSVPPRVDAVLVVALATVAFSMVVGLGTIDPTNLRVVSANDSVTHYLGWEFFRRSPWTAPLGASPDYGLEIANAIVFSDSIPLLAFVFKPFSSWLPERFQYFGAWLYACFLLQAWFGWKLASLISDNRAVRILVAGMCVFSPPMLFRLRGHNALLGHWTILAAFWLALRPRATRTGLSWTLLIGATALVHFYLLTIAFAIWSASLVGRLWSREVGGSSALREGASVCAVLAVTTWQAGYFTIGADDVAMVGFGLYRLNLLSLVDPSGWSYVLKDLAEKPHDYEGFNFLGLGNLLALVLILPPLLMGRFKPSLSRKSIPLVAVLAGLALLAISHNVGLGSRYAFTIPLPEQLLDLASLYRCSGRLFWPVFYALVFGIFYVLVRHFGERASAVALTILLAVQVADTRAGWLPIGKRPRVEASVLRSDHLKSEFWGLAAQRYRKVRMLMPTNTPKRWYVMATYALSKSLATNAVYLARVDRGRVRQARDRAAEALRTGSFDQDTLYVLNTVGAAAALASANEQRDLVARVDEFVVLAPGWKVGTPGPSLGEELRFADVIGTVSVGERIGFGTDGRGSALLLSGWHPPETDGTWTEMRLAELVLPIRESGSRARSLTIEARAFVEERLPRQVVEIAINGVPASSIVFDHRANPSAAFSVPIPDGATDAGNLRVSFTVSHPVDLAELGVSIDSKQVGIELSAITIQP